MASVLHLLASDLPTGTMRQIRYLSAGLQATDWQVGLCSFESKYPRRQRLQRFLPNVEWCHHSLRLDPTFVIRCARLLRSKKADIVHCWGQHPQPWLRLALRMASVRQIVWSVRSDAERQARFPSHGSGTTVTNAHHLAQALPASRPIRTIANGVAPVSAEDVVAPLHHELNLPPNSVFLAAMGDLRPKKRLKDIIWAFDLLRVIRPNIHLLILGAGEQRSDLAKYVRTALAVDAIHFLEFRYDTNSLLRQCACFWQASSDEGCSNAMLEAMSAGLPVVASDISGHREILQGGELGAITPLGDCAAMARKTNMLLQNRQAAEEQSQRAQAFVKREYAVEKMVDHYCAFYAELLGSQQAAA